MPPTRTVTYGSTLVFNAANFETAPDIQSDTLAIVVRKLVMTPLTTADHPGPTAEYDRIRHTIIEALRRSFLGSPEAWGVTLLARRLTITPNAWPFSGEQYAHLDPGIVPSIYIICPNPVVIESEIAAICSETWLRVEVHQGGVTAFSGGCVAYEPRVSMGRSISCTGSAAVGTLGGWVTDVSTGEKLAITAGHVVMGNRIGTLSRLPHTEHDQQVVQPADHDWDGILQEAEKSAHRAHERTSCAAKQKPTTQKTHFRTYLTTQWAPRAQNNSIRFSSRSGITYPISIHRTPCLHCFPRPLTSYFPILLAHTVSRRRPTHTDHAIRHQYLSSRHPPPYGDGMGKTQNGNLFFPIRRGWDTNKLAAIIDGKAYRTLGSYSVWGASGGREDMREHIDAISRGSILVDNSDLPATLEVVEPAQFDALIESGKAALVALVLEDQQMNDTINVLLHTTCQVSYCNKPLQPTTREEDTDMIIRRERESAPSPEPDADPNPYTAELLNLKQEGTPTRRQEMQDPELEEVLNKEITGMTVEDRVIELKIALEDDQVRRKEEKEEERELREREISDLMGYISELQREYREGHGEVMGGLATQINDIREALSLLNRHMASQIKSLSKQVAELTTQLRAPPPPSPPAPPPLPVPFWPTITTETPQMNTGRIVPDGTESTRESSPVSSSPTITPIMSQCTFTADGRIIRMKPGSCEEAQDALRRADNDRSTNIFDEKPSGDITISDDPKKDTYVKDNEPFNNRGASNQPEDGQEEPPASKAVGNKKEDPDSHMTNNVAACLPGLSVSQYAGQLTDRAQDVGEATAATKGKGKEKEDAAAVDRMFQRANAPENRLLGPGDKPRAKVIAATQTSAQKGATKHRGVGGRNSNRKPPPEEEDTRVNAFLSQDIVEAEVTAAMEKKEKEGQRRKHSGPVTPPQITPGTREETNSTEAQQTPELASPGTGSNATPIRSRKASRQTTPPAIGKAARPGTGANATPIGPSRVTTPPTGPAQETEGKSGTRQEDGAGLASGGNSDEAQLVEGKPGRIQRTAKGNKGYWNRGPENTADISPPPSRPTSVQVLITGCPTIPARGDEWKRSFLAGFNARRERLAPETPICATQVSFAFSYPTERVITIRHPPNMKHEEIIRAVARHPNQAMISILQETTELVAPGLQGTRGEKAWDRADGICKSLKLVRSARPPKWLVKGKGDGYEGKKCSLRFSVTTASLRAIKAPLPIVHNGKSKIYLYQRVDDKAFYVDEMNYMVSEPRPSHSPEPIQTWGACMYCHRVNHTEDKCWSKRNADAWRSHNGYQDAAVARNTRGRPEGRTRRNE
ncbi:hypothetical protein L211DRAFT_869773 [Terfezia boudieri ATCC MYA-4762]|uniref:Uncharacterized protein n=1 Tax=Terfezia boudieri ATCC MYA-4762 TaxID=1051890 RepID=A0A3N4LG94_9PEZI|nr:hypothetical protein L211DRAFT_869773 [Terfezia boudieri ATCC MYA-4762]